MAEDEQYWFNTETKSVEKGGPQSHFTHRMGPYPTEAAAKDALATAAARNEKWDEEDEEWDEKS